MPWRWLKLERISSGWSSPPAHGEYEDERAAGTRQSGAARPVSLDTARMQATLRRPGLGRTAEPAPRAPSTARSLPISLTDGDFAAIRAVVCSEIQRQNDAREQVLTREEVADFLGVCGKTADKLVKHAGLPVVILGSQKRFLKSQVVAWLKANARTLTQSTSQR